MKKLLFADLDGTLIKTISGNTFPKGIWDMRLRFKVLDVIKLKGYKYLGIVSNQGGIELGYFSEIDFLTKMSYIAKSISEYTGIPVMYDFCPSNNKLDLLRKPNPGMLSKIVNKIPEDITKEEMEMIGDASGKEGDWSDSDLMTAKNFGIEYKDVEDFIKL